MAVIKENYLCINRNRSLKRKTEILLLSVLIVFIGCERKPARETLFFEDFSFKSYGGINNIAPQAVEKLKTTSHRFYELIFKGDRLDSMIVFHPWDKSPPVIFRCNKNDSVVVFETLYGALGAIKGSGTYLYCDNNTFVVYINLKEQGWIIQTVTNKRYSREFDFLPLPGTKMSNFENMDTTGFVNKLLRREKLRIINTRMIKDTINKLRMTPNFTFNAWFDNDYL